MRLRHSLILLLVAGFALSAATVPASSSHAEEKKSWIPDLPPPDAYGGAKLEPYLPQVPRFRAGEAFGRFAVGLSLDRKMISADAWQMPGVGGTFDPIPTNGFTALSLNIGAILLHGHVEVFTNIPLLRLDTRYGESGGRDVGLGSFDLGGRWYPWALAPGKLRPFVVGGLSRRKLVFSQGGDDGSDVRQATKWTLPIGLGAAFLTDFGLLIDVQAQAVLFDNATLWSGVDAVPFDVDPKTLFPSEELDVSGLRLTLGLRWTRGLWTETADAKYAETVAKRLLELEEDGLRSDLTVSLGLATQLLHLEGNYINGRRPYLEQAFDSGLTPQIAVGWHHDPLDAEARLSFRYLYGGAEGYGSGLKTRDAGVFLEAIKKFDLKLFGIVPWIGLGVGYCSLEAQDTHSGGTLAYANSKVVLSIPAGWDYRPDPSSWWLLRTSFRWIPSAQVDLAEGATFNHGGLELEFISLVIHPRRLMQKIQGRKPKLDAAEAALKVDEPQKAPPAAASPAPSPAPAVPPPGEATPTKGGDGS